jgi:hypothetical protein
LPDALLNVEAYGEYLRAFDPSTGAVEDEPRAGIETVITIRLVVGADLEGEWALYSRRAEVEGLDRWLAWKDRLLLSPVRIGSYAKSNLTWTRGSVLNRLTEERIDLGAELAVAARNARTRFGHQASEQLAQTLKVVTDTAKGLGVPIGNMATALLDANSVSIGDGAVSLHSESGIPLRSLGTGSARLLVAGLQRKAADTATIALVDEVEHGLEPHRLARLLDSLGAKEAPSPLQVFMTSHSPVALRELCGDQVSVVRPGVDSHNVRRMGTDDDVQGTLRKEPEAFLAKSVLVCEGASEVGFARGLDQFWVSQSMPSFFAMGGAYVDTGGSNPDRAFLRGTALAKLGYRTLVLVDADRPATQATVDAFHAAGGTSLTWRAGRAIEDEIFLSLDDPSIMALIEMAIAAVGRDLVEQHILSKSSGACRLSDIEAESLIGGISEASKRILGAAAQVRGAGWFKSVTAFQRVAREVVGPNLVTADGGFQRVVESLRAWMHAG